LSAGGIITFSTIVDGFFQVKQGILLDPILEFQATRFNGFNEGDQFLQPVGNIDLNVGIVFFAKSKSLNFFVF
jgi:hypothetical protein